MAQDNSKPTEEQVNEALQNAGDAMRAMRDSLKVKYAHFLGWIGERRPVNEVIIKVIRTFQPEDVIAIGDTQLLALYEAAKIAYETVQANKEK